MIVDSSDEDVCQGCNRRIRARHAPCYSAATGLQQVASSLYQGGWHLFVIARNCALCASNTLLQERKANGTEHCARDIGATGMDIASAAWLPPPRLIPSGWLSLPTASSPLSTTPVTRERGAPRPTLRCRCTGIGGVDSQREAKPIESHFLHRKSSSATDMAFRSFS